MVLVLGLNLNAQRKTKQEVIELMAEDTCMCVANKKIKPSSSLDYKQVALGLCLITSYDAHKSKSKYFIKQKVANFEEIGEEVGFIKCTLCAEDFMSIFSTNQLVELIDDENNNNDKIGLFNDNEGQLTIAVELHSMNNAAISYIEAKDDFDKNYIFLFNEVFEGYDLLKK